VIPLSLTAVAEAVGGTLVGVDDDGRQVSGVTTDSRAVGVGDLFVAVVGARVDGHDFAASALAQGGVAVLGTRAIDGPSIVVPDVLVALADLARAVLAQLPDLTVVAVTGSAGKTSTKDLLAEVLGTAGPTVAPAGSYNNELGLPLTVLSADEHTRFLVLEMGARGAGHIRYLCGIAAPHVAVVLMVGSAHIGEFGGRDAIARAKSELVAGLRPNGTAVLNADDDAVVGMVAVAPPTATVVMFGTRAAADVRADDIVVGLDGRASFRLVTDTDEASVSLQLVGAHHVTNALATAAVAVQLGLPLTSTADALSAATPRSRWRMEVVERPDGITVINDAYNASPESVRAALQTLATIGAGRRTWAVLGEMRELGAAAEEEHAAVGRLASELAIDRVVVVGAAARGIVDTLDAVGTGGAADDPDRRSVFVPDVDAAIILVNSQVRPGDVVLVKAARAVGLEQVAEALVSAPTTATEAGQ
jgi:UDP-N-acetylmuramoyl-tripeptide--D-alanyl-D-alanine ligase